MNQKSEKRIKTLITQKKNFQEKVKFSEKQQESDVYGQ